MDKIHTSSDFYIGEINSLLARYEHDEHDIHPFDLKELLVKLRDLEEEQYYINLKKIPNELLAEVVAELPSYLQEEASEVFGVKKLAKIAEEMDTDDAADFIQNIGEKNHDKAETILEKIDADDREVIRNLIAYDEDVAGAYMQTELFSVSENEIVGESIKRLRELKRIGEIQSIGKVYIVKESGEFICSIGAEELVLIDPADNFKHLLETLDIQKNEIYASQFEDIKDVIEKVSDYNLSVIPVVNEEKILLGRITSDDIYDLIESQATDEIFSMAGLNADVEQSENLQDAAKKRALWLGINLLTAIAASVVIALFHSTIESFVALAVLMPIVASMGGNAGTQSLTVTVRQLSVGEIDMDDAIYTIKKEVTLALMNGFLFALIIGLLSFFWFNMPMLGIVIALSTIINLFVAGFCGAIIPLFLDKVDIDPAVASTVILTTLTDIIGFFSFLGLAKLLM